jgi:hypothetical protein
MPKFRHCLQKITSDDNAGYLAKLIRSGFGILPKSMQAELHLLNHEHVVDISSSDNNTQNDLKLINLAGWYHSKYHNVIVISNDKSVISLAKNHNIPVESLRVLDQNLAKVHPSIPWNAQTIIDSIPQAKLDTKGNPLGDVVKPKSFIDAIENASDIVTNLLNLIEQKNTQQQDVQVSSEEELLVKRGKQLVEEWQYLLLHTDPFAIDK